MPAQIGWYSAIIRRAGAVSTELGWYPAVIRKGRAMPANFSRKPWLYVAVV